MDKKLIIFDFDDTLTDNSERDVQSFIHIDRKFNLRNIKKQKIIQWRRSGILSNSIIKKLMDSDDNTLFKKCVKQRSNFLADYNSYIKYVQLKHFTIKILSELNSQNHILILNSIQSDNKKFQEILKFLQGESSLSEVKEQISIKTRQYAKRQNTWARGQMIDWQKIEPQNLKLMLKKF